ncbi:Hypothetical protein PHPALM_12321 [Phytophthora palmivora]|uniref:Uncharacterized protein n=1 Tax=Phytophthora palmivora TaxID=4796 RepID=A0A2P4Y019_9STRA|nr:Hypothetical protein PHPALM_12321 [Phytophthora palmivora]
MLATQVHFYRSARVGTSASNSRSGRQAEFLATNQNENITLPPSVVAVSPEAQGSDIASGFSGAKATATKVSSGNVLSAVNDLLSRLNVTLDTSVEDLMAENLRLQRRLEVAEAGRRAAAAQIDTVIREKKEVQDSLVCAVCLENQVNRVLIPAIATSVVSNLSPEHRLKFRLPRAILASGMYLKKNCTQKQNMVNASPIDEGSSPTSCSAHPLSIGAAPPHLSEFRQQSTHEATQLPILIEERLRDLLGEPLSSVDRASVQLIPLRSCLPGEIVAVQDSDGVLRYGKVRDEEPSGGEVKIYFFQSVGARSKEVDVWKDLQDEDSEASTVGVIAEVNALLARLNVSLSTSYEELLAEMLRLQHRAALAEEDRRAVRKQIEQAMREKRDAEKALCTQWIEY